MAGKSNEVTVIDAALFPALQGDAAEVLEAIVENLDGETIRASDLDRVKMPSGGGLAWEVPSLEGPEVRTTLNGVIVHVQEVRAFFAKKYDGGNEPPECSSADGKIGVGNPGGPCALCPLSQFGSKIGEDGQPTKAQACQQRRQVFVLTDSGILPIMLSVPATSLKPLRDYMLGLSKRGLKRTAVSTIIGLEKEKSGGGIDYSRATFRFGGELEPDVAAKVTAYAETMRPFLIAQARPETGDFIDAEPMGEDDPRASSDPYAA